MIIIEKLVEIWNFEKNTYICNVIKKKDMENNNRIKEFIFLRKDQAYRIKAKDGDFDYLYIRGKEVGIISKWNGKGYILYDYELQENIHMGHSMLEVVQFLKKFYKL